MADGVFDPNFWQMAKLFVSNCGVEPLTLGETQEAIWNKIYLSLVAAGINVSRGISRASLISLLNSALLINNGIPDTLVINGVVMRLLLGADMQPLQGYDGQYLYGA